MDKQEKKKTVLTGAKVGKNEPHVWNRDQVFTFSFLVEDVSGDTSLVLRTDAKPIKKGKSPHLNQDLVKHQKETRRKKENKKLLKEHHQKDL